MQQPGGNLEVVVIEGTLLVIEEVKHDGSPCLIGMYCRQVAFHDWAQLHLILTRGLTTMNKKQVYYRIKNLIAL